MGCIDVFVGFFGVVGRNVVVCVLRFGVTLGVCGFLFCGGPGGFLLIWMGDGADGGAERKRKEEQMDEKEGNGWIRAEKHGR